MTRSLYIVPMLLLCTAGTSCKEPAPPAKEIIRPVRYIEVLSTGAGRSRKFAGTSQAGLSSVLSFKVAGTVKRVAVKAGDKVQKGQIIAALDSADYELQVQQARASAAQARAQSRNAKASFERVRALYENNNATRSDLDSARAGYDTARAQVTAASKSSQLAQRQLDYCVLRSPGAGTIDAVPIDVNENVNPGQPIANLSGGEAPEVIFEVPEILIAKVTKGTKVKVRFDALEGKTFEGSVSEVGVASGAATTFPVTVQLGAKEKGLRPRMAAEIELTFEGAEDKERFVVPPLAVGGDHEGKFVFLAEPTEEGFATVKRKAVQVGDLTSEGLEVQTGLVDGDRLVTAGVSRLRDGQKVRLPKAGE